MQDRTSQLQANGKCCFRRCQPVFLWNRFLSLFRQIPTHNSQVMHTCVNGESDLSEVPLLFCRGPERHFLGYAVEQTVQNWISQKKMKMIL